MLWRIAKAGKSTVLDFAAGELARCLKQMDDTAETMLLAYSAFDPDMKDVLWLGVCPELKTQVPDPVVDDMYAMDVRDGAGVIRGANERSVLMGVYRFLRELGCSWVRPGADGEYIPKRDISSAAVQLVDHPVCRHRGICIEGAVNYRHVLDMIDWMPKVGFNSYFNQFQTPVTFYNRWYDHQLNPLLEGKELPTEQIAAIRDQTVLEMKRRGLLHHDTGHGWTCEPFGIPGEDWDAVKKIPVPAASRKYLAKVNGKRDLWKGIPLNTNLCYSNPQVRKKIAKAVAERCLKYPDTDFLHIWLADGVNNHCECDTCVKMRPSDWYLTLLNDVDAELTRQKIDTKIVFLMYVDLLWQPEQVRFQNPDRFVLMFAPITRTYSASYLDAPEFDEQDLPPYERNKLKFPSSVGENMAWLRKWKQVFPGDSFDYDYHFGRDHYSDPSYYDISRTVFRDMRALKQLGLSGNMSCQAQRVFFPTGLGLVSMAAGLWGGEENFEAVADRYFRDAFGEDGELVHGYLKELSVYFDPVYLRCEKPVMSLESAEMLGKIPGIVNGFRETIKRNLDNGNLHPAHRASWKYLLDHSRFAVLYARAFELKARGRFQDAVMAMEDLFSWCRTHEEELNHVFDGMKFQTAIRARLTYGIQL